MTGWGAAVVLPAYTPPARAPFESLRTNGQPRGILADAVGGGGTSGWGRLRRECDVVGGQALWIPARWPE